MLSIFFKKRKKQYELEKQKLYSKIQVLKNEKKIFENQVESQSEKFKRIKYLLDEWVWL